MPRRLAAAPGSEARPAGSLPTNRPLLLVGGATATVRRLSPHPHLGRFTQPRSQNDLTELATCGAWWAADNDALQGLDVDAYLTMLDQIVAQPRDRLLFVTAPDAAEMTPDGPRVSWEGTLWLWRSWRRALLSRGLPLAIVLQDGATVESVPWDELAAVFLGGSDAFKDGPQAVALLLEARRRGLWRHVGRVNTQRRERLLWPLCDSFDGTAYSRWPDTHIPPCLARLSAGQRAIDALYATMKEPA
jgi:hypothetical protein